MAYVVDVSSQVHSQLENAVDYIAIQLASPRAMQALVNEYEKALDSLAAFPSAYPVNWEATDALGFEVRRIAVNNYGLFYRVIEAEKAVQAFSFLHSRQQIAQNVHSDYESSF